MLNKKDILGALKKYDFPKDEFIIISGASMVLQDAKLETRDIDISVSDNLYHYLLENYDCELEKVNDNGTEVWFIDDIINFSNNFFNREYIIQDGYKMQTLDDVLKLKLEMNRDKDNKDIEILRNK